MDSEKQDNFKESFKKYKNCKDTKTFKNFKEIFEPERAQEFIDNNLATRKTISELTRKNTLKPTDQHVNHCCEPLFGLTHPSCWEIFEFNFPKGLIFIKNPFTSEGQRYWISKCLTDYPKKPHITNIDNLNRLKQNNVSENDELKLIEKSDRFYKDLRWITFGYHHDWDSKEYSEDKKCDFPQDLSKLTKYLSIVLGYEHYEAEAAIVNYYHLDSTLSGHQDRSEKNQFAPLFSISFGQTAVFLIGSNTKDKVPLSVYLKSGDIVVMTGQSRLSYHAVPKILPSTLPLSQQPWMKKKDNETTTIDSTSITDDCSQSPSSSKKLKLDNNDCNCLLCDFVNQCSETYNRDNSNVQRVLDQWSSFHETYISKSRINLNVRQVLFPGQKSLNDTQYFDERNS